MRIQNKPKFKKEARPLPQSDKHGFAYGKLLGLLILVSVLGVFIWVGKGFLDQKEEKIRQEKYHTARKGDFLVKVQLSGTLASTEVEEIKCALEGTTTIESIVDEGTEVNGTALYTIQAGDTLASIAVGMTKDVLSEDAISVWSLNIQLLNKEEKIDWNELPVGQSITLPGSLLVELDPLNLKERINQMEIVVQRSQNNLSRALGNMETLRLTAALSLKRAENDHQIAINNLDQLKNDTVPNKIKQEEGDISNLEKDVALADKNLNAYNQLRKLGFVSEVEVLREGAKRAKTVHTIEMTKARLEAYKKYEKYDLISNMALTVEEAKVNIAKTKATNIADMRDANATILTQRKTLELEMERLEDLNEQMAATKIYAPSDGTVVYFAESYKEYGPIMDGARVHRGRNLIKLPKTKSLKVELNVPQSKRRQLEKGMDALVYVERVALPGTLTVLANTVDTNRRGQTQRSNFKAEVTIDSDDFPVAVSPGLQVAVEIHVIDLRDDNQRIKVPNQCVTLRTNGDKTSETGCYVLDPRTGKHKWRPVDIEYSDETFIAIKPETVSDRGLKEGELVHLAPLTEAEDLNLEAAIQSNGSKNSKEGKSKPRKEGDPIDSAGGDSAANTSQR